MDTPNDFMRERKRREVSENQDWSKLCPDLLRTIIERLSYFDYHGAKSVCSDWYSVLKTCVRQHQCPWRIICNDNYSVLFNPGEDKIYTAKLVKESYYMASSGNWLLMVDSRLGFYIYNLLTCKKINLPSMESPIRGAQVRFERSGESGYGEWGHFVEPCRKDHVSKDIFGCKRSAVLWIDERTWDYVVAWIFNKHYLFTHKKGDDSWWNWNKDWNIGGTNLSFLDLAYKNSKLYLYTTDNCIKIIDFSGDYPKEEIENNPYWDQPFRNFPKPWDYMCYKKKIAIQKSGEVLIILSLFQEREERYSFYIFKMNLESGKWERVDSIGDDEMLIFGHGVTIRAPVQDVGDGVKSGSICFVKDDVMPGYYCPSNCGVFDLATSKITWPKRFSVKSQWFVPGFA